MTWWEALGVICGLGLGAGTLLLIPQAEGTSTRRATSRTTGGVSPGGETDRAMAKTPAISRIVGRVQQLLDQAGWGSLHAPVVVALWALIALVLAAVVGVLVPIPVLMLLALVACGLGGRAVLRGRIAARQRRLRAAWPGLVDHIRQVIRSGGGVAEAVAGLEHHSPEELRGFFSAFGASVDAGARVDSALAQLKDEVA
ncbi:MAG: hypothetical protein WD400_01660, partial [Pontimonas sp.]